jgi:serine/threonine protein phosphatase PrpC
VLLLSEYHEHWRFSMSSDPALIRAYLENILGALVNEQPQQAEFLTRHALDLLAQIVPIPSAQRLLPVHLSYAVGLDTGIIRANKPNEDYAWACSCMVKQTAAMLPIVGGLFIVADGVGGHSHGCEASRLAVHALVDYLFPRLSGGIIQADTLSDFLVEGVQWANQAVYQQNSERGASNTRNMMGTTLTVALSLGRTVAIANVGDSRAYLLRQDEPLRQLTRDHSVVADLVMKGDIRPEDVYTHPHRNQIYRCLGERPSVDVDTFDLQLQPEDILLLCSDGLWEMVRDETQIEEVLSSDLSAERKVERLVHLARKGGGYDNISALVMHAQVPDVENMPTMLFPLLTHQQQPVRLAELMNVQRAVGA